MKSGKERPRDKWVLAFSLHTTVPLGTVLLTKNLMICIVEVHVAYTSVDWSQLKEGCKTVLLTCSQLLHRLSTP